MKIPTRSLLIALAVLLLAVFLAAGTYRGKAAGPAEKTFTIYASSYDYHPSVIRVEPGDRVTLRLVSTDVVHGIYIDGYDLNLVADPGKTESLTFVAARAGSFRLRCSVSCGALHPFMIGRLEVGGSRLFWPAAALAALGSLLALAWSPKGSGA
jgi:heme/copper-type cytochrome/quinol oxidase subunit 2